MAVRRELAGVNSRVLRWARETTGESTADVARATQVSEDQLTKWERGEGQPTYPELERLAGRYHRPLALFFFPEVPEEKTARESFRSLSSDVLRDLERDTRLAVREAYAMQVALRDLTNDNNPAEKKIFLQVKVSVGDDPAEAARRTRETLDVSVEQQWSWASSEQALKNWRAAVESLGVFVFKRPFKQRAVSGFCVWDAEFPIIYLNNSMAFARQTFTLFHELAHVLLGDSDILGEWQGEQARVIESDQGVESFCNRFAAELLVPADSLKGSSVLQEPTEQLVREYARQFGVSPEVVLRRVYELGAIGVGEFRARVRRIYEVEPEPRGRRAGDASSGNYYNSQRAYLGDNYINLVVRALSRGTISHEQFGDYLGMKPRTALELRDRWLESVGSRR